MRALGLVSFRSSSDSNTSNCNGLIEKLPGLVSQVDCGVDRVAVYRDQAMVDGGMKAAHENAIPVVFVDYSSWTARQRLRKQARVKDHHH